jgi:acyl transferase domain-containing protein
MAKESRPRIALIGMAGRFPGAGNTEDLWRNLLEGVTSTKGPAAHGTASAPGGFHGAAEGAMPLAGMESFDAEFFDVKPDHAPFIDPQSRIFLECTWEAMEHAGYDPADYPGMVSLFGGCCFPTYLLHNLMLNRDVRSARSDMRLLIDNDKDSFTSLVAYKLGLSGPAVTVQTFSSTSLVATHLACQSLISGESDLALAGAAAITVPNTVDPSDEQEEFLSPDGVCRSFDARANGAVFACGVGVVVLKRMEDALRDGDHIYCQILGSAVNGGGKRSSYLTPHGVAQADVIRAALQDAKVSAHSIGYVEGHGIGTRFGDWTELKALTLVFGNRPPDAPACFLGSVKANLGHLEGASGAVGLIKVAFMLDRYLMPPQINFSVPSKGFDAAGSVFQVSVEARTLASGPTPFRAGVSSFGVTGVNAHVVMEEAPYRPARADKDLAGPHLLILSAKTLTALEEATRRLSRHLRADPRLELADVAYTLQVGRSAFAHRRVISCDDRAEALAKLAGPRSPAVESARQEKTNRPMIWLIPDTPQRCVRTATGLYASEPAFQDALEECAQALGVRVPVNGPLPVVMESVLDDITFAMTVRYALGQLLLSYGYHPKAVLGDGRGALIAQCLTHQIGLEDALIPPARRGRWSVREPAVPKGPTVQRAPVLLELGDGAMTRRLHGVLGEGETDVDVAAFVSAQDDPGASAVCALVGRLWLASVSPEWQALHQGRDRRRVALPTYPFERRRHWIEPTTS